MSSIRSLTLVLLLAGTCRAEPADPQSNPEHTLRRPWGQVLVLNGSKHIAGTGWGNGASQSLSGIEAAFAPGRGSVFLEVRIAFTRNLILDLPLPGEDGRLIPLNTVVSTYEYSMGLRKDFWLYTPRWTPWVSAGVVLIDARRSVWNDDLSSIQFEGTALGSILGAGVQLRFLDHGVLGLELRHSSAWTLLSPRYGGDATDSYHSNSGGRSIALTFGLIW
ncbi:MAG: hypothetical protein KC518_11845 [Candidatus Cloacimonetes bacterium]|nr:hypothetical protein [Candidatus Cloacimonadota bacterium]